MILTRVSFRFPLSGTTPVPDHFVLHMQVPGLQSEVPGTI